MGYEDQFLDNPIIELTDNKVEGGHATKHNIFPKFRFPDYESEIIVGPRFIMYVVGISMALESWNFNLLGEPLALNFIESIDDSLAMKPM